MDTPNPAGPTGSRPDLDLVAEVLDRGLREPLAALRATLDSFARHAAGRDESSIAEAAIAQVVQLSRTVHDLSEFASPSPLRPLRCSLEEIVRGALELLPARARPRVLLALEDRRERLLVDGPLLSRCLALLMADGLHADAECMLHVRRTGGRTRFVVVHTAPVGPDTAALRLGRALARRDVDRMGGSLAFHTTAATRTSVVEGLAEGERQEAAA